MVISHSRNLYIPNANRNFLPVNWEIFPKSREQREFTAAKQIIAKPTYCIPRAQVTYICKRRDSGVTFSLMKIYS